MTMKKMAEIIEKVERNRSRKENPFSIGDGEYLVKFRKREDDVSYTFKGICENFSSSGLSAFWNEEKECMLLVHYKDILGLYPIK